MEGRGRRQHQQLVPLPQQFPTQNFQYWSQGQQQSLQPVWLPGPHGYAAAPQGAAVFYPSTGWQPAEVAPESSFNSSSTGHLHEPHARQTSQASSSSQGSSNGPESPGSSSQASAHGSWGSSMAGSTYCYGYAAVPCVLVPTGSPIFYAHGPLPPGGPGRGGRKNHFRHHQQHTWQRGSKGGVEIREVDDTRGVPDTPPQEEEQCPRRNVAEASYASSTCDTEQIVTTLTGGSRASSVLGSAGASICRSGSVAPSSISSSSDPTSWGDLTIGILQVVISKLGDDNAKQLRLVCRHWMAAVDTNLEQLTPSTMKSRLITMRFPHLRVLHLTNCSNVRNRDLMLLSKSGSRLHTLTLGDDANKPWVTNLGLGWIGKITTLTSLNLQDCTQVTNNGLAELSNLNSLTALSLKGCIRLTNAGLQALQSHTQLSSLNLSGCVKVSDKGLLPLTGLPSLLYLALGHTRVCDEGMQYLAQITSLHELHFVKEGMTDNGIKQLSTLTNLQTLALRECAQVSGDALSQLVPKLHNLQSLDLFQSYEFDDVQLAKCLDFLGSVTFLDLRGTVVSEEGIQQLARLQNLQKLCLAPKQEMRLEQQLCVVSHLTQLTSLAINNCRLVSFDLLSSLMHLKLLRELDISNSGQTSARQQQQQQQAEQDTAAKEAVNTGAIEAVAKISTLTSIDLSRRQVKDDQLATLAERLPRLRTLFVVGCPVHYHELQALQRRFPELCIHRKPPIHDPPLSCASSDQGL